MKNLFSLLLFVFTLTLSTNAQLSEHKISDTMEQVKEYASNVQQITDSLSIPEIDPELKKGIMTYLQTMADSLGVAVNNVFDVIVKQQLVKSIVHVVIAIIFLILIRSLIKSYKKIKSDPLTKNDDNYTVPRLLSIVVLSIAFLILSGVYMIETITGFVNPEFGAYQDIIMFIKNKNITL